MHPEPSGSDRDLRFGVTSDSKAVFSPKVTADGNAISMQRYMYYQINMFPPVAHGYCIIAYFNKIQ
jgi:hypothetical protein